MESITDIKILISKKICSELLEEQITNLMKKEEGAENEEINPNIDSFRKSLDFLK